MTRKAKAPIELYSALADATRCRIVEILRDGPIPVHRLADAFAISRPAISRHLRVLKTAGLVAEVKKGRENLYALRPARLDKAIAWIEAIGTKAAKNPVQSPIVQNEPIVVAPPSAIAPETLRKAGKSAPVSQMGFDF